MRWLRRSALVVGLLLAGVTVARAADEPRTTATAELAKYRAWVAAMKGSPRGPFSRLRWFCTDGTVLPPTRVGCAGHADADERRESPRDYPDQDRVWAVRVAVHARDVPAFGLARLDVRDGVAPAYELADAVSVRGTALRASWGGVRVTRDGFTVVVGGRTLRLSPGLMDERDEGDTYTIQPVAGDRPLRPQWGSARMVWTGPLVVALARPFRIGGRVRGTVYLRIDAGSPLLRVMV